ncbi:MAG: hypothetical protein ACRCZ0_12050 [Cetobacterium sp.]
MGKRDMEKLSDRDNTSNLTKRERCIARAISLIFHLNNNKERWGIAYLGYLLVLSRYNFSKKEWEVVEEHNFTTMGYAKSYQVVHNINTMLKVRLRDIGVHDIELEGDYD